MERVRVGKVPRSNFT